MKSLNNRVGRPLAGVMVNNENTKRPAKLLRTILYKTRSEDNYMYVWSVMGQDVEFICLQMIYCIEDILACSDLQPIFAGEDINID